MTEEIARLTITDLICPARIGVHDHEKKTPQRARITVELHVQDRSAEADALEKVVCYDEIAEKIRALALEKHHHLVETLARRIADLCLEDARIFSARVRVEKPDTMPDAAAVGAEIEKRRGAR